MTSSASTCVDLGAVMILSTGLGRRGSAISTRWSEAGIDGYPRIYGMTAGSFIEGKLLRPQADRWISVRGHTSALLTTYNRAPRPASRYRGCWGRGLEERI